MVKGEENGEKSFIARRRLEAKAASFYRTGKIW
jgi:hypothetical protein